LFHIAYTRACELNNYVLQNKALKDFNLFNAFVSDIGYTTVMAVCYISPEIGYYIKCSHAFYALVIDHLTLQYLT